MRHVHISGTSFISMAEMDVLPFEPVRYLITGEVIVPDRAVHHIRWKLECGTSNETAEYAIMLYGDGRLGATRKALPSKKHMEWYFARDISFEDADRLSVWWRKSKTFARSAGSTFETDQSPYAMGIIEDSMQQMLRLNGVIKDEEPGSPSTPPEAAPRPHLRQSIAPAFKIDTATLSKMARPTPTPPTRLGSLIRMLKG